MIELSEKDPYSGKAGKYVATDDGRRIPLAEWQAQQAEQANQDAAQKPKKIKEVTDESVS